VVVGEMPASEHHVMKRINGFRDGLNFRDGAPRYHQGRPAMLSFLFQISAFAPLSARTARLREDFSTPRVLAFHHSHPLHSHPHRLQKQFRRFEHFPVFRQQLPWLGPTDVPANAAISGVQFSALRSKVGSQLQQQLHVRNVGRRRSHQKRVAPFLVYMRRRLFHFSTAHSHQRRASPVL